MYGSDDIELSPEAQERIERYKNQVYIHPPLNLGNMLLCKERQCVDTYSKTLSSVIFSLYFF